MPRVLLPILITMLAACQSAPPVEEAPPPSPAPVEYEPASEQLEQIYETADGEYVPLTESAAARPAQRQPGISPETIALANEIAEPAPARKPAPRARASAASRPAAYTPAPAEETYLLPMAPRRAGAPASKGGPLQIAEAVALDINPYSGGTWITEGPNQFWSLRLRSVGASSLSLYFKPLRLPPGAELSFASPDGSTRHGPYTAADLQGRQEFWTPSVPGDTAVVRLKLPPADRSGLQVNLAQARIGYQGE